MPSAALLPRTGGNDRVDRGPEAPARGRGLPDTAEEETLLRQWEPLVRRLAGRWGSAAEREDLEQVARIALWQAARRFDPARGHPFITYAVPTIRGAEIRFHRPHRGRSFCVGVDGAYRCHSSDFSAEGQGWRKKSVS